MFLDETRFVTISEVQTDDYQNILTHAAMIVGSQIKEKSVEVCKKRAIIKVNPNKRKTGN